jgi:CobQ-like glutamine amidotransferase family enzyme
MGQRMLSEYLEGTISGATVDAYTSALSLDTRSYKTGTIVIKNTHASAALKYKITGYANAAGTIGIADVSEAEITFGNSIVYERTATKCRGKVVIEVKSSVGSTPATYIVEYIQVS